MATELPLAGGRGHWSFTRFFASIAAPRPRSLFLGSPRNIYLPFTQGLFLRKIIKVIKLENHKHKV